MVSEAFASTSSDEICLASSEHLIKYIWKIALCFSKRKCYFAPSNLAHTPPKQDNMRKGRQQVKVIPHICTVHLFWA